MDHRLGEAQPGISPPAVFREEGEGVERERVGQAVDLDELHRQEQRRQPRQQGREGIVRRALEEYQHGREKDGEGGESPGPVTGFLFEIPPEFLPVRAFHDERQQDADHRPIRHDAPEQEQHAEDVAGWWKDRFDDFQGG